MKKFIAVILVLCILISMSACSSSEPVIEEVKVEECTHEHIYKKNFTKTINGENILAGQICQCLDCGYEYTEYSDEYENAVASYLASVENEQNIIDEARAYCEATYQYVHENSTTKSICPKCQKESIDGCKNPRYCPYCKFDRIEGITLSTSQLNKLIGAEPETVKEACKTCGDVVAYMKASKMYNYRYYNRSTAKYNNYDYDINGYEEVRDNIYSNCTGKTNLFNYLLEGDYDDQGILVMNMSIKPERRKPTNGGTHFIAYFKLNDKFYTVDIDDGSNSSNYRWNFICMELDDLNTFVETSLEDSTCNYIKNFGGLEYLSVFYYNVIGDTCRYAPYNMRWLDENRTDLEMNLPDTIKDYVTIVYQKDELNKVNFVDIDFDIPGWNCIL